MRGKCNPDIHKGVTKPIKKDSHHSSREGDRKDVVGCYRTTYSRVIIHSKKSRFEEKIFQEIK